MIISTAHPSHGAVTHVGWGFGLCGMADSVPAGRRARLPAGGAAVRVPAATAAGHVERIGRRARAGADHFQPDGTGAGAAGGLALRSAAASGAGAGRRSRGRASATTTGQSAAARLERSAAVVHDKQGQSKFLRSASPFSVPNLIVFK